MNHLFLKVAGVSLAVCMQGACALAEVTPAAAGPEVTLKGVLMLEEACP